MTRLTAEAEGFAARLTDLLRRTVNDRAGVQARVEEGRARALVGVGVRDGVKLGTVPVPVGEAGQARLLVSFICTLDVEGEHLTVQASTVGLYLLPDRREPLFRYEFDRSNTRMPQAHLHVNGQSHALGRLYALAGKDEAADLHRLHLPVGGKRFRPSVEDVLECLFQEKLLRPLPGWQDAVEAHRDVYMRRQLKAAVRADPEPAVEELRRLGYVFAGQDTDGIPEETSGTDLA